MKYAIVKRNHGRPGGQLEDIAQALAELSQCARYFNATPAELRKKFAEAGYNVFNPKWTAFVDECLNRNNQ